MSEEVNTTTVGYPKLKSWEVWNFMSVEHGLVTFDERGIINFKGYNDSGKSSMLRALDVLMYNIKPMKQVEFIQDDKDYFRVQCVFDDGVIILRDKYINGQSLYEMYKGDTLLFSTKNGNTLTRVDKVPDPIFNYLGMLDFDGMPINSRSCFEERLGVETKGSMNYKMFNTVLKSEEIACASALLNTDKNKVVSDMSVLTSEIEANKSLIVKGSLYTAELIQYLRGLDASADTEEEKSVVLHKVDADLIELSNIPDMPVITSVDTRQLDAVIGIASVERALQEVKVYDEIPMIVGSERLNELATVRSILNKLETEAKIFDEVKSINDERLQYVLGVLSCFSAITENESELQRAEADIKILSEQLDEYNEQMKQLGVGMIKCPSCGKLFALNDEEHKHEAMA